jgi:two-component system chemotaxis sensor kinase CheA
MGLIVDEILDIVEERLDVQMSATRPGFMGSAIIGGKSTEVIDAGHYLTKIFKDWFGSTDSFSDNGKRTAVRALLVDDSAFFRNMLTPLLSTAGYQVTTVDSAIEALKLCEKGEAEFDIIISDIEMPGMSGFEFVEKLKSNSRWASTPVVALSSHATAVDKDRGQKAGFSNHVAKFDRDGLLTILSETVHTTRGAA